MSPRRSRLSTLGLVCMVLLPLATLPGCRGDPPPDDVPIRVDVSLAPTPPIVGPVRVVLTIVHDDGTPVEEARVQLEGTMTHAGMAPVHEPATHEGGGRWVIPAFEFTMGGDWVLTTRVQLPDGREALRRRQVTVLSRAAPDPPQEEVHLPEDQAG